MSVERLRQVQQLFEKAVALPADQHSAFLARECGEDAEMRAHVESLLEHDHRAPAAFLQPRRRADGAPPDVAETQESPHAVAHHPQEQPAAPPPSGEFPRIEGYEIVRELHRGGQGIVYQAIQKGTKRKVAIKVLLEGSFAGQSARRRFEREIELVARLRHASIVEVFHSGTTPDGRQYFVMDYVRGTPLDRYVREKKPPLEEALTLFAKVCEAVNYAHQRGVIHRDLKPSNILVDSDGVPKVLDFGLAKQLAGPDETLVSLTGQVVGTLPYLSPEQARGNPDEIDIRTDVYSLGVVLYEMLTGCYPYPVAGQMADVLKHIAETPPTPPSRTWKPDSGVTHRTTRHLRAGACPIDDEVQTIVLRALAKERERRYQSAGELARDVGHYLRGEVIEAKRDSAWYVLRRVLKRHKTSIKIAAWVSLLTPVYSVALTFGLVWVANNQPYALVLSDRGELGDPIEQGPVKRGDRAALVAFSGHVLRDWHLQVPEGITFAAMVDRPAKWGGGKVVVLGFSVAADSPYAGSICIFDAARPRDEPIHTRFVEQEAIDAMPRAAWPGLKFDPKRQYRSRGFGVKCGWMMDVFAGDEHPGDEIVLYFHHGPGSQGVVRIYNLNGELLFQAWQDGGISAAHWFPQSRRLVLAAIKGDKDAWEYGLRFEGGNHPWMLLAIEPKPGEITNAWINPHRPDWGPAEWYEPIWCKAPCPTDFSGPVYSFRLGRAAIVDGAPDAGEFATLRSYQRDLAVAGSVACSFSVILDSDGRIVHRNIPNDDMRRAMREIPGLPNPISFELLDWTGPEHPCVAASAKRAAASAP